MYKKNEPVFEKENNTQLLYHTRTEEVQEIIGRMPSWIIRWGITTIGVVLAGLLIGSYFIKYPDKINAEIFIMATNPPAKIRPQFNAFIEQLYIRDSEAVHKGQLLAIIKSDASYNDIMTAKKIANTIDTSFDLDKATGRLKLAGNLQLGSLSGDYIHMLTLINKYKHAGESQKLLLEDNIWNLSRKLSGSIETWKNKFCIISPMDGNAIFSKPLKNDCFIDTGQVLMVIANNISHIIVTGSVGVYNVNKIKVSQEILISPYLFPGKEFGFIKGKISSISPLETDGKYYFNIDLPNGLVTTSGNKIIFQRSLNASGEIITRNSSLLHRVFQNIMR